MKIKTLVLALVLFAVIIAGVHAFGFGVQANFRAGEIFAPGAALLISPSNTTHLAINWFLDFDKVNTIGFTLDAVPLVLPLAIFPTGSFNFTLGVGLFTNVVFTCDTGINAGLRVPLGFNLLLGRRVLEVFSHVAPSFGVNFLPRLGLSRPFYPIALGVRLWLR